MAQLDDKSVAKEINDIGSKHKIVFNNISFDRTALSNAIQSALNGQNININLGNANFNTQVLASQAQQAGVNAGQNFVRNFSSQLNQIPNNITFNNLADMKKVLGSLGVTDNSFHSITQNLRQALISINEISTSIKSNGNLQIKVTGIDKLNNLVTLTTSYDKAGKTVGDTNIRLVQSFEQQEKQIQKNNAAIIKYQANLDVAYKKAIDQNASKPITNKQDLTDLEIEYQRVRTEINNFGNANSQTFDVVKANIDAAIKQFDAYVLSLQRANTFATDWRARDVQVIKDDYAERLRVFNAEIQKSGISLTSFKSDIVGLNELLNKANNPQSLRTYLDTFSKAKSEFRALRQEQSQFVNATEVNIAINKMETWLRKNQKAAKAYGDEIHNLINRLKQMQAQGGVLPTELKNITNSFTEMKTAAAAAGLTGRTFFQQILGAAKSLGRYFGVSTLVYRTFGTIKNGIKDIVDLDTALVDLKKTTDGTEAQLNSFYYTANESAKKLGVTTKEIISAASDWSRLGYSLKDAETMAQVSAKFEAISPNVDMQKAQDGLVSAMKAFNIEANDALDGIASKINAIGKILPKHIVICGEFYTLGR